MFFCASACGCAVCQSHSHNICTTHSTNIVYYTNCLLLLQIKPQHTSLGARSPHDRIICCSDNKNTTSFFTVSIANNISISVPSSSLLLLQPTVNNYTSMLTLRISLFLNSCHHLTIYIYFDHPNKKYDNFRTILNLLRDIFVQFTYASFAYSFNDIINRLKLHVNPSVLHT